jgi:hypothetical protein
MDRAARGDEGGDLPSERARIDDDGRALDDAEALELLDAIGDGGTGEPDLVRDLGGRRAPVLQKKADDAKVEIIQIDSYGGRIPPFRRRKV